MRPSRLLAFVLALGIFAACAPPPDTGGSSGPVATGPLETPSEYGPGDYCANSLVFIQATTRSNFSLGSSYFNEGDYCAAYPYLAWLLENDPLFTAEEPDDRNYLRMAGVYEQFAAQVDSTNEAERKAYLDSALATRQAGVAAMEREGITYDPFLRDLYEGFFYFQNASLYDGADELQYAAFNRAFDAQPDSLADWYLNQLYIGSAVEFGNEAPNPERAEYLRRLSEYADNAELKTLYADYADYVERDPTEQPGGVAIAAGDDTAVRDLVERYAANGLTDNEKLVLLSVVIQQPDRIESVGGDVAALQSRLLTERVVTDQVDNPRTLFALAIQNYRNGNSTEGNRLFQRAIDGAASNSQRADFYYSRGAGPYGSSSDFNRALEFFPGHGPSLYRRAGLIANAVGRPSSVTGRFAYWCLADIYRNVAASSSDGSIAAASRRAAAGYERAGPSREQYFLAGYRPGQSVSASLGSYGSCTTRVR